VVKTVLYKRTIRAMQLGIAAGVDGIETKHLCYSHTRRNNAVFEGPTEQPAQKRCKHVVALLE